MMKSKGKPFSAVKTPICVLLSAIFCSLGSQGAMAELPDVVNGWTPVQLNDEKFNERFPSEVPLVYGYDGVAEHSNGGVETAIVIDSNKSETIDIDASEIKTIVLPVDKQTFHDHSGGMEIYSNVKDEEEAGREFTVNFNAKYTSQFRTFRDNRSGSEKGGGLYIWGQGTDLADTSYVQLNVNMNRPVDIDVENISGSTVPNTDCPASGILIIKRTLI